MTSLVTTIVNAAATAVAATTPTSVSGDVPPRFHEMQSLDELMQSAHDRPFTVAFPESDAIGYRQVFKTNGEDNYLRFEVWLKMRNRAMKERDFVAVLVEDCRKLMHRVRDQVSQVTGVGVCSMEQQNISKDDKESSIFYARMTYRAEFFDSTVTS